MSRYRNTYADLCRLLTLLPNDAQSCADDLGMTRRGVYVWLRQLRAGGVITVGDKQGQRGRRPYFLHPSTPHDRIGNEQGPKTVARFIKVWHAMARRNTAHKLADDLGIHRRVMSEIVRQLHRHGLIRIAGWEMHVQNLTAIYDRLPGADAPRPPRKPREYVNSEHWARSRIRAERMAQNAQGVAA